MNSLAAYNECGAITEGNTAQNILAIVRPAVV